MVRLGERVECVVKVRGGPQDWQLARDHFAQRGWSVEGEEPSGAGVLGELSLPEAEAHVFGIELRVSGSSAGVEVGAENLIRIFAEEVGLELYVLRCRRILRERDELGRWRPVDSAQRHRDLRQIGRKRTTKHLLDGRYDLGHEVILGTPIQALRIARLGRPNPRRIGIRPERRTHLFWSSDRDRNRNTLALASASVSAFGFTHGLMAPGAVDGAYKYWTGWGIVYAIMPEELIPFL